jgi:hypothetical protein
VDAPAFLTDADLRSVSLPAGTPFRLLGLASGQGASPLEVLAVEDDGPPAPKRMRTLWKERNKGRAAPLLVVPLFGERAVLCGPTAGGDDPPVHAAVERGQAESLCREALEQPDRHAALRYLRDVLPAIVEAPLPGLPRVERPHRASVRAEGKVPGPHLRDVPRGWDYSERLKETLKYFRNWKDKA